MWCYIDFDTCRMCYSLTLSLSLVFEPQYLRHNGKGNTPLKLVTMFYLNVISLGDVIR